MTNAITAAANQGLRNLSDREVDGVSGAAGSVKTCDVPRPAPTTGSTAGILLFPLVYKCN
ncbi:MAG: hypothetical protein U1E61_10405 [Bradyrhizobium sp.]